MPSGKSLWNDVLSSQRRRSTGSLRQLRQKLWHGIRLVDAAAVEAARCSDLEEMRRQLHLLSSLSAVYVKVFDEQELAERLKVLEQKLGIASSNGHVLR